MAPSVVFCVLANSALAASPARIAPPSQPLPSGVMLAAASPSPSGGPASGAFMRPNIRPVRIDPSEAPVIDADLSDPAWAKAAIIDNFTQRSPNPYEPAT